MTPSVTHNRELHGTREEDVWGFNSYTALAGRSYCLLVCLFLCSHGICWPEEKPEYNPLTIQMMMKCCQGWQGSSQGRLNIKGSVHPLINPWQYIHTVSPSEGWYNRSEWNPLPCTEVQMEKLNLLLNMHHFGWTDPLKSCLMFNYVSCFHAARLIRHVAPLLRLAICLNVTEAEFRVKMVTSLWGNQREEQRRISWMDTPEHCHDDKAEMLGRHATHTQDI